MQRKVTTNYSEIFQKKSSFFSKQEDFVPDLLQKPSKKHHNVAKSTKYPKEKLESKRWSNFERFSFCAIPEGLKNSESQEELIKKNLTSCYKTLSPNSKTATD